MTAGSLGEKVFQIVTEFQPITSKEILQILEKHSVRVETKEINSLLYGPLRNTVVRDVNQYGVPTWKVKTKQFSAASGLEIKFYNELIKRNIISKQKSQLGFTIKNTHRNIRYSLDIAVMANNNKYNIEIDGFDHIRADALASIELQIKEKGRSGTIEPEWMDNKTSFVKFGSIDTATVYKWCGEHIKWCIRYHEELLWPRDINRNIWLIEKGWKVIRFWNVQIRDDMKKCADEVKEWIEVRKDQNA